MYEDIINVAIVEDHTIFLKGLKLLFRDIKGTDIIGEYSNGKEFLASLKIRVPHIVFMDINMPEIDGIEATTKALKLYPKIKVIALTMRDDEDALDKMMNAGAKAFLLKNATLKELVEAMNAVLKGKNYFSKELMTLISRKLYSKNNNIESDFEKISRRELDILKYLCKSYSSHEIAEKLCLSVRTVEVHRRTLLKKTGSKNTVALVMYALSNKLVEI